MLTKMNIPGLHGGISQQSPHLRMQNQHSDVHNADCSVLDGLRFPRSTSVYQRSADTVGSLGVVKTTDAKEWLLSLSSNTLRLTCISDGDFSSAQVLSLASFSYLNGVTEDKLKVLNLLDTVFVLNTDKAVATNYKSVPSISLYPINVFRVTEVFPSVTMLWTLSVKTSDGTPLFSNVVNYTPPAGTTDPEIVMFAIADKLKGEYLDSYVNSGVVVTRISNATVTNVGRTFRAKVTHVADAGNAPTAGGNAQWEDIGAASATYPAWVTGTTYRTALSYIMTNTPTFSVVPGDFGTHPYDALVAHGATASFGTYLYWTNVSAYEKLPPVLPTELDNCVFSSAEGYYVKYVASTGRYVETTRPGESMSLSEGSMPHELKYTAGVWTLQVSDFVNNPRMAGDATSCPAPDMVGRKINSMFYHRNRLCFLADNYVVMSRASEPYKLFPQTAQEALDDDPISVFPSSVGYHKLLWAEPANKQLYLFAADKQYVLHSGYDALTPKTVAIDETTSFRLVPTTDPVQAESSVLLLVNNGQYNGVLEYRISEQEYSTEGINLTEQCPKLIPAGWDRMTYTSSPKMIFIWKKDSPVVYVMRLHRNSEGAIMQMAWQRWTLPYNVKLLEVRRGDELWVVYYDPMFSAVSVSTLKLDAETISVYTPVGSKTYTGAPVAMDVVNFARTSAETFSFDLAVPTDKTVVAIDWDSGIPCILTGTDGTIRHWQNPMGGAGVVRTVLFGFPVEDSTVTLSPLVLRDDNGLPENNQKAQISKLVLNWTGGEFSVLVSGEAMPERTLNVMPRTYDIGSYAPGASYSEVEPTKLMILFPAGRAVIKLRHKGLVPTKINGVAYELDIYRD